MLNVSINNQPVSLNEGTRLNEALEQQGFAGSKIAVAINGEFVPRSHYGDTLLQSADSLDIVKPVGGG